MLCPNCGFYSDREESVCPECGKNLLDASLAATGSIQSLRQGKRAREAAAGRVSADTSLKREYGVKRLQITVKTGQKAFFRRFGTQENQRMKRTLTRQRKGKPPELLKEDAGIRTMKMRMKSQR